jgi:hypothetical protein
MKKIVLFFCFSMLISCKEETSKIDKPTFLIGNWIRTNDQPNQKTYEIWKNDLTGIGFTLNEKETIFKEELEIIRLNDTTFLKVSGVNERPVLFAFTKQTDTSFVCENKKNDFPQKIHYYLENNLLKAAVSSPDFKIEFVFKRNN